MRARCVSRSGVTVSGPRVSPASTTRLVVTSVSQATRRIGIGGQEGVQHRVAEPVGDLVGMAFGDGFGGEQELARVAHGWVLSRRGVGPLTGGRPVCGGKPPGGQVSGSGLRRAWLQSPRSPARGRQRGGASEPNNGPATIRLWLNRPRDAGRSRMPSPRARGTGSIDMSRPAPARPAYRIPTFPRHALHRFRGHRGFDPDQCGTKGPAYSHNPRGISR